MTDVEFSDRVSKFTKLAAVGDLSGSIDVLRTITSEMERPHRDVAELAVALAEKSEYGSLSATSECTLPMGMLYGMSALESVEHRHLCLGLAKNTLELFFGLQGSAQVSLNGHQLTAQFTPK